MRQKRAKQYRKQMLVYKHTFNFREPYQVIVDDQLVQLCESQSFDLAKGLARTIQAEVKPMITQCCMQELYKTKNQSLIELAKTFERRRCNHPPQEPLQPHECIKSIVIVNGQNKHRYVVATENERLRWSLRKIPGIPLIYMNRAVMVMEPLSKASAEASRNLEAKKLTGGLNAAKAGIENPINNDENEDAKKVLKKRKGPKEPNPLSVKKRKKTDEDENKEKSNENSGEKKKRRRKHKGGRKNEEGDDQVDISEEDKSASDEQTNAAKGDDSNLE